MTPFERASTFAPVAPGRWEGEVDESWLQGRAIYGGMQAAIAARCMQTLVPPAARLRSLHVHFCGATEAGRLVFTSQVLRAGRNVVCVEGRLRQHDALVAAVTATFAAARAHWLDLRAPARPAFAPASPVDIPIVEGIPAFTQHLDFDLLGTHPYAGAAEARIEGWVRFKEAAVMDAPLLAALADSWAPAAVTMMKAPRPAASVDMTLDFVVDDLPRPLRAEDFFAYQARSESAGGGYAQELGALWLPDGELGVRVRQIRALY